MNLARHAAVLWRFRAVTAAGLLLAVVLAIAASYRVSLDGGPSLVGRGTYTYSSQSRLLVTQPGFPDGRVVLPTAPVADSKPVEPDVDPNRLEFGDPARFTYLTDLYTKLLVSDEVRRRTPERPAEDQIEASPLQAVSGAPVLPIIELTVKADSPGGATALNGHTIAALRELLADQQARNGIMPAQSVVIVALEAPSPGVLTAAPSNTASQSAVLLCLMGTVAITHLLESLRPSPRRPSGSPESGWAMFLEQEQQPPTEHRVERAVVGDGRHPR